MLFSFNLLHYLIFHFTLYNEFYSILINFSLQKCVCTLNQLYSTLSCSTVLSLNKHYTTSFSGYPPAEAASDKYHGVAKFDVASGKQKVTVQKTPTFTTVFANSLIAIAENDRSVCAITAAMPGGTGLDKFGRRFPKRTFDVGIAEQHAITFAAGMAVEGLKPFAAIYSTFMQRAYDQIIHDVALQQLPVRMVLDRAGLVGNDGATHHGSFDLAYLGCVPDIVIMAPADEVSL